MSKPEPESALPPSLITLARLLGELLGGDAIPPAHVSPDIAALALRRHEVGSMLYAVAQKGRHSVSTETLGSLERCYQANVEKQAQVSARLNQIAEKFGAAGISWMAFKGLPMATLFYTDPAWRFSADTDILVSPRQFSDAARVLQELNYTASNPPLAANPVMREVTLSLVRDVKFIAHDDRTCAIELHQRPFFANGRQLRALQLRSSEGALLTPRIGADLALYMLVHGAISYWVRLKWLLDLVPLMRMMTDADKCRVSQLAETMQVEASLAASLRLLQSLFPFVSLGPLAAWLEPRTRLPSVQARVTRYCEMLSLERDWRCSPLDNRNLAFESYRNAFEAPSIRLQILVSGAFSSLTRRVAGSIFKAERALSTGGAPP